MSKSRQKSAVLSSQAKSTLLNQKTRIHTGCEFFIANNLLIFTVLDCQSAVWCLELVSLLDECFFDMPKTGETTWN